MESMRMLVRYKLWADDLLYKALSEVPPGEVTASRKIVFGSILETLNHVYAMDVVWKAHLLGIDHGMKTRRPESCPTLAELRRQQQCIDEWYIQYADSIQGGRGNEIVEFTFIGGGKGSMSRESILLHVVNHTTYHRGHIGDMMYESLLEPPTTDLPVFLKTHLD